jgi:hypothetical protein
MNHKKKIYWVLIISFVSVAISLVLGLPEIFGLCSKNDISCQHDYIDNFNEIIQISFSFSVPLIVISLILLFLKEQAFKVWLKFAAIFLPIAIVLISLAPITQRTLIGFDREKITLILAAIFFITSLFIIILNFSKQKK